MATRLENNKLNLLLYLAGGAWQARRARRAQCAVSGAARQNDFELRSRLVGAPAPERPNQIQPDTSWPTPGQSNRALVDRWPAPVRVVSRRPVTGVAARHGTRL